MLHYEQYDALMRSKVRITAFIGDELAARFTALTRRIGVSGTALLSKTLSSELDYLAAIPTRSERVEAAYRFIDALEADPSDVSPAKLRRLNITLDRQVADRMGELCREKHIQRDQFINSYINFLVHGEEAVCRAPLETVAEILRNPRHDFEEKRRNSPREDQTLYNLKDESFTTNQAVSQRNPYDFLSSIDDDLLDRIERSMKKGRQSK